MEDRFTTLGATIEEAELFHGYLVVLATFTLNFAALGTYFSAAVYLLPLQSTFPDEGRGRIAFFPSTYLSIALFASLPAGWLQDKLQQRNVSIKYVFMVGALCLGFGPALSSCGTTLNAVLAGAVITGCGIGLTGFIAAGICVQWFQVNRGTMLLLAMAGQGCGNFTYCNIVQWLIHEYFDGNWRMAMRLTALVSMTIGLVASTVMRLPNMGEVEDYEASKGWQTPCTMEDDLSLGSLAWKNSIEENIMEGEDEDAADESEENTNDVKAEEHKVSREKTNPCMAESCKQVVERGTAIVQNESVAFNEHDQRTSMSNYGSMMPALPKEATTLSRTNGFALDCSASHGSFRSCASHFTNKSDARSVRTLSQSLLIASQSQSKSKLFQNPQVLRNETQHACLKRPDREPDVSVMSTHQLPNNNSTRHDDHNNGQHNKNAEQGNNSVHRRSVENRHTRDDTSLIDGGSLTVNTGGEGIGQTLQRQATIMAEFEALSSLPVNYPQIIIDSRRHKHSEFGDMDDEESVSILSHDNQSFLSQDYRRSVQSIHPTSQDCFELEDVVQTRTVYCLLVWSLISSFAFTNFFVHLPAYAASVGLSTNVGSHALSKTGLCMLVGNVTLGGITDRIGSIRSLQVTMMGLVFCQIIWPDCRSAASVNTLAGLYGYMATTQASVPLVILADAFGSVAPQAILTLVGLQNICKFPGYFLGPMMVGQAYDLFGHTYNVAALMTAIFMFLGNLSLFLIPSAAHQVETVKARYKKMENA